MRRGKSGRRSFWQRGVAAVEFALVLPVLLLFVLGLMDYGWFFFCQLSLTNAVREGARAGTTVVDGDAVKARSVALSYLTSAGLGAQSTQLTVTIGATPTTVAVEGWMHFSPLIGFVPLPRDAAGPVAHARAVMLGVP